MAKKYLNVRPVKRNGKVIGYSTRLHFPFDESLGRKPKPKEFFGKTQGEADAKRSEYKRNSPAMTSKKLDKRMTLGEFFTTVFIPDMKAEVDAGNLGFGRYRDQNSRVERFILPSDLAQTRLAYLEKEHVKSFFIKLVKDGVGPDNQRDVRDALRQALAKAEHLIPHDRLYYFDWGTKILTKIEAKKRPTIPVDVIFQAISDESKPLYYRSMVAFLFCMGCRCQDQFGLLWEDVDLDAGTVTFGEHAVRRGKDGLWENSAGGKTGTEAERRVNSMPRFLTDMMRGLRGDDQRQGHVFTTVKGPNRVGGRMLNMDLVKPLWAEIRTVLELPDTDFYALKHAGNSFTARMGISAEVRAAHMGHSSPRMAMTTYRSIAAAEGAAVAGVFDSALVSLPSPKSQE